MKKYMWSYKLYSELSHAIKSDYLECGIIPIGLMEKRELLQTIYTKKKNARSQLGARSV